MRICRLANMYTMSHEIYIFVGVHIFVFIFMCVYVYVCMHVRMQICISVYVCMYISRCIDIAEFWQAAGLLSSGTPGQGERRPSRTRGDPKRQDNYSYTPKGLRLREGRLPIRTRYTLLG